jgi:hypothetical protein
VNIAVDETASTPLSGSMFNAKNFISCQRLPLAGSFHVSGQIYTIDELVSPKPGLPTRFREESKSARKPLSEQQRFRRFIITTELR